MRLFKDYSKEFKELHDEIVKSANVTKSYIRGKNDKTLIQLNEYDNRLEQLEKQYDQLFSEVNEIKQILLNNIVSLTPNDGLNGSVSETVEIKHINRGGHIKDMANFEQFSKSRYYDLTNQKFYSLDALGRKWYTNLSFDQLVSLIQMYKSGRKPAEIQKNPLFKDIKVKQIRLYTYLWRAGSFNETIKDNARKLGYNPQKLISHEAE